MNQEEMRKEYQSLYNLMASSNKPEYMHTFGNVMSEMVEYLIQTKPDVADEMIQKLESIKWRNYLSPKEAQKIVDNMVPKGPWTREVWKQAMTQLNLPMEEEPYYNTCALWTEMNKQWSDHAQTLADNVYKKPLNEIPVDVIVPVIRAFAVDLLKDKDGNYNIREYFHL